MDADPAWANEGALRAAFFTESEDRRRRAVIGGFAVGDASHRSTLLRLEKAERMALFSFGTRANWGAHGLVIRAARLACDAARSGDGAAVLSLAEDLMAVRGVAPEVHISCLEVLWRVPAPRLLAARAVAWAAVAGAREPAIFHEALRVAAKVGDDALAETCLRHAARYGADLSRVRTDPELAPLASGAGFRRVFAMSEDERRAANLRWLACAVPAPRPTARAVLERALLLSAIAWRASLPNTQPLVVSGYLPKAERRRQSLCDWLRRHVREQGSAAEWSYLEAPVETSQSSEDVDRSWSIEAAAVLAWALGLRRAPPLEGKVEPEELMQSLGLGAEAGAALLERASWREAFDAASFARQALAIHWRAVEARVRPGPLEVTTFATRQGLVPFDFGRARMEAGDLVVAGKPIATAKAGKVDRLESLALERHRAARWLSGLDAEWNDGLVVT